MNKIAKYINVFAALAVIAGCTGNFEDYNKNQYEPSALPVNGFLPGMIDWLASPEENPCQRNNTFWGAFGGYVTATNSWSKNNLFSTYNVDDDWNKWTQNETFTKIYSNWFQIKDMTNGTGYHYQMAQLFRIHAMVMIASIQGPMPYTQIADGALYVPYDDEPTVWHALFEDLDAAINQIAATASERPIADVDRVYYGDNTKWLKFANTLKLRMAMRISNVEPEYARQKAEEAVASGVMTSTNDSAYDHLDGRYKNGYYTVGSWGEVKANATIVSYMQGYSDPRTSHYFTGSSVGARSGVAGTTTGAWSSRMGLAYGETDPMPIMYAAEAAFLRAEGALKGWDMGAGTPQSFYEEGIRLSFDEWGATGADAYIANSTALPGNHSDGAYSATNKSKVTIAWNESDSAEKKLEKIITQKWIANFPLGLEGWSDFRRTGYPYIYPPYNNLSNGECSDDRGQRRVRFSADEYLRNSANTLNAVKMLSSGRDSDGTDLWWALKEGSKY